MHSVNKNNERMFFKQTLLLIPVFFFTAATYTQGIIYGKKYEVAQNNSASNDTNPGTAKYPFKTISKAAALAKPGDTVLVHSGLYREWVAPACGGVTGHPITYMAAPNEKVIISGSEIYTGKWYPVKNHPGVFSTTVPYGFFDPNFNPFKIIFSKGSGGGRQGQIFINGNEVFEAKDTSNTSSHERKKTEEKNRVKRMYEEEGTWATEDGETIYFHLPKNSEPLDKSVVEFSVRRHLFAPVRRAQNYINVKGFIFEHCANDASLPQVGAVSCRSGQQWVIENNIIRNIKTIGLDCGAEAEDPWTLPDTRPEDRFLVSGHHDIFTLSERRIAGRNLILNNIVSDCGQCGIAGLFSDGSVIMGNIVERCGHVIPGFESGGIKIHGLMGGTIEGNLVRDNGAWGIWLDCGFIGSRVTRNVVVNNKTSGIFFECSNGPGLIDDNIIAYNKGDGIYTHDASGVNIANNLIFGNTRMGIYMCVATDRLVPPYFYATGLLQNEISACSWERIHNNVIIQNKEGAISLPYSSNRSKDNLSDYNLFNSFSRGPRFVINLGNGEHSSIDQVESQLRKAFNKSANSDISSKNMVLWGKDEGLNISMKQWEAATSNDIHSLTGNERAHLDLKTFHLTVILDKSFDSLDCTPVTTLNVRDYAKFSRSIDKDFSGSDMPVTDWHPGAFQFFKEGKNEFVVWPVKFQRPDLPPKVAIQPPPGSPGLKSIPKGSYQNVH